MSVNVCVFVCVREKGERMREKDDDKLGRKMKPRRARGMLSGPH